MDLQTTDWISIIKNHEINNQFTLNNTIIFINNSRIYVELEEYIYFVSI